jgi:hypothetical protein
MTSIYYGLMIRITLLTGTVTDIGARPLEATKPAKISVFGGGG